MGFRVKKQIVFQKRLTIDMEPSLLATMLGAVVPHLQRILPTTAVYIFHCVTCSWCYINMLWNSLSTES